MKWVAISGGWRKTNEQVERDVRAVVREIITKGNGIVSGGALGVDYIATDEALKLNPLATQIRIYLPTTLEIYAKHYRKMATKGIITSRQAKELISQLERLVNANKNALIENHKNIVVNTDTYYERNTKVIESTEELVAFHINSSEGTKDTINKAKQQGITVKEFVYTIN